MMEGEIFRKCIIPANESADGEPGLILVTKELNCVLVWLSCFEVHRILKDFCDKNQAIEWAILEAPAVANRIIVERMIEEDKGPVPPF